MKVELEKTFPMPAAPEVAWACLQDIEGVAGCMPGAKITERIDATHFKGTVSIRVGPASMSFRGDIEVRELEANQRLLHLIGKGSDTTGSSGASMDLVARIEPNAADGLSQLVGRSEVTMSGKAAAFGGRMMGSVADQILKQFAGNFAAQVRARAAAPTAFGAASIAVPADDQAGATTASIAAPVSTNRAASTPAPASTAAAQSRHSVAMQSAGGATTHAAPGAEPTAVTQTTPAPHATSTSAPVTPANELNFFALVWAIVRDWFRGLFRRRTA